MGYTGAVGDGVADISRGYGKILLVVDIAVIRAVEILLVMLKKSEQPIPLHRDTYAEGDP